MDATPPSALIICPSNVTEGDLVELDGSGSSDNVGISNWTWWIDFQGETEFHYGEIVEFRPQEKGRYYITLQVMDERGLTSMDSKSMEVRESGNGGGMVIDPWLLLLLIIIISIIVLVLMVMSLLFFFKRQGEVEGVHRRAAIEEEPGSYASYGSTPPEGDIVSSGVLYSTLEE
jgi:hypothetical protein